MSTAASAIAQDLWREVRLEGRASIRTLRSTFVTYVSAALLPSVLLACWLWTALFLGPFGALIITASVLGLPLVYGLVYSFSTIMALAPPMVAIHQRERYRAITELKQRIGVFERRELDWDGAGGRAPSADAVADAISFLDQLPDGLPEPDKTFAPGDGEVMFQWDRKNCFVEVGFYGDETISWFARCPDGSSWHGDDAYGRQELGLAPHLLGALQLTR